MHRAKQTTQNKTKQKQQQQKKMKSNTFHSKSGDNENLPDENVNPDVVIPATSKSSGQREIPKVTMNHMLVCSRYGSI